jgi:hypothetical protein
MIVRIFELFGIPSVRMSVDFPELQELRGIPALIQQLACAWSHASIVNAARYGYFDGNECKLSTNNADKARTVAAQTCLPGA